LTELDFYGEDAHARKQLRIAKNQSRVLGDLGMVQYLQVFIRITPRLVTRVTSTLLHGALEGVTPCLLLLANNQVLPRLNAYELHCSWLRASERTNHKITEDGKVLVYLTFNVVRNITIPSHSETLLGNTEHPPGANSPEAERRSPVVNRQPATDSKAAANQLGMFPA
jgi:hypothetical protein